LPNFIKHFLDDRQFKVRLGSTLSDSFQQEMGVPQGSILSPVLFSLKINSIVKCLMQNVDSSLYVDDFLISYSSKKMSIVERKLQNCLKKLEVWCSENGFKFSQAKTVCVHFSRHRGLNPDPVLILNNGQLPVKEEAKFLGLIFDRKLSFIPHLKYLKEKCSKALNLLRVVANRDWGGDRTVLLRLYRSLIRSKLDYGCFIYGAARPSYLKMLDPVANQGLRLALGAFRTSPVDSLYAEAGEPPLQLRREKLALQYAVRLSQYENNPTYQDVFNPKFVSLFERKPNAIPSFGIRIKPLLAEINFDRQAILNKIIPKAPPWSGQCPHIDWSLSKMKKGETSPEIYLSKFKEIMHYHRHYKDIYTDGSKVDETVAAAAISEEFVCSSRLADRSSVFSAEVRAVQLALEIVKQSEGDSFIIFSDSKSCLQALSQTDPDNPLVASVLKKYHLVTRKYDKTIDFCWVPSHIGIPGNERVDREAKEALSSDDIIPDMVASDVKCSINSVIKSKHQNLFDALASNKLKDIQPQILQTALPSSLSRRDEVVITRAKIGHSHLTHSFLLKGEDPPECVGCQCPCTIAHILIHCVDFLHIRTKYFNVTCMQELFSSVSLCDIIKYLKEINLYNKF